MEERRLERRMLEDFREFLVREEKGKATVEKYRRDCEHFRQFLGGATVCKSGVLAYKNRLLSAQYAPRSVNSMLSSVNALLRFLGWEDCRVKSVRLQQEIYCPEERELTKEEYGRLVEAAEGNERLQLVLQTICSTGIRVSELQYFTVEAVAKREVTVRCKGKTRRILLPGKLPKILLQYARRAGVRSGPIFRTKRGTALSRGCIWEQMKRLCARAKVKPGKVFPHNLRKLFARSFYRIDKDIAKLADILGHSSINTTRIYIMSTGSEHRRKLERLGLLLRI